MPCQHRRYRLSSYFHFRLLLTLHHLHLHLETKVQECRHCFLEMGLQTACFLPLRQQMIHRLHQSRQSLLLRRA